MLSGTIQAQEDPSATLLIHEARIERSDTDPTYIMDDSPKRRQFQAKVNEERRQAKKQAKLEALQAKEHTAKQENAEASEPEPSPDKTYKQANTLSESLQP